MAIRYPRPPADVYCTSYCNHGHDMRTGKPVRHACYILPPRALELERDGFIDDAIDVLRAARPLRPHSGVRNP